LPPEISVHAKLNFDLTTWVARDERDHSTVGYVNACTYCPCIRALQLSRNVPEVRTDTGIF